MAVAAAAPGAIGGGFARADEVKRLQAQVDQLKERVDFMNPMLSTMQFIQDFFQSVECEAQVQLMRLNNAQVQTAKDEGADEDVGPHLDTVKWLHFMTDAIISFHNGNALRTSGTSPVPQSAAPRAGAAGYPRNDGGSPGLGAAFPSLGGAGGPNDRRISTSSVPGLSRAYPGENETYPETPTRQDIQPGTVIRDRSGQLVMPRTELPRGPSDDVARSPAIATKGFNISDIPPRPSPTSSGGPMKYNHSDGLQEPLAEPESGAANNGMLDGIAMSGSGGLIMGRGSWATAYRQASGHRREALRLLCTSGIVTARELSDDLTVISEEHIEECVQIGTEMLQTWTLEMWSRQPQEAKKFFEARLTAMYQRKFNGSTEKQGS